MTQHDNGWYVSGGASGLSISGCRVFYITKPPRSNFFILILMLFVGSGSVVFCWHWQIIYSLLWQSAPLSSHQGLPPGSLSLPFSLHVSWFMSYLSFHDWVSDLEFRGYCVILTTDTAFISTTQQSHNCPERCKAVVALQVVALLL